MTAIRRMTLAQWAAWLGLACFGLLTVAPACAGDLNLHAQLIWGTNEDKPADKDLKDLKPELRDKLRRIFKWKNYFEVNHQKVAVPSKGTKKTRLSDKCEIEVEHLGAANIEVRLIGKGKLVTSVKENLSTTKFVIVAGDDKRDNAWFVVVTLGSP